MGEPKRSDEWFLLKLAGLFVLIASAIVLVVVLLIAAVIWIL